jgi:hypothetical protein
MTPLNNIVPVASALDPLGPNSQHDGVLFHHYVLPTNASMSGPAVFQVAQFGEI